MSMDNGGTPSVAAENAMQPAHLSPQTQKKRKKIAMVAAYFETVQVFSRFVALMASAATAVDDDAKGCLIVEEQDLEKVVVSDGRFFQAEIISDDKMGYLYANMTPGLKKGNKERSFLGSAILIRKYIQCRLIAICLPIFMEAKRNCKQITFFNSGLESRNFVMT
jgi:hypothetical protein